MAFYNNYHYFIYKNKIILFIFELWVDIKINYLYYEFYMQKQLKKPMMDVNLIWFSMIKPEIIFFIADVFNLYNLYYNFFDINTIIQIGIIH